MDIRTGIGQDSHRFDPEDTEKKLVLGGVLFDGEPPLKGNSDADVVLHALTNALSGITGKNILGRAADNMCLEQGITDSREYVKLAIKDMQGFQVTHVSFSLEGKKPRMEDRIDEIKETIAGLLNISKNSVGLTATTGEELTSFGKGLGIQVFCIVTAVKQ